MMVQVGTGEHTFLVSLTHKYYQIKVTTTVFSSIGFFQEGLN